MKFSLRQMLLLVTFICVVFALSDFEYHEPYYEARGFTGVELCNLNLGVYYTWPAKGFDRTYCSQLTIFTPFGTLRIPEDYQR